MQHVTDSRRQTASELTATGIRTHWSLPSGTPVQRRGLCTLAQPCLVQVQHTPRFQFHEATVLLVAAGQLDLDDGINQISFGAPTSLLLVEPGTCADLLKTPTGPEKRFRSIFLTLSPALLEVFRRDHPSSLVGSTDRASYQQVLLDEDLESTLRRVLESLEVRPVSDERLELRLLDLLLALAERGHRFKDARQSGTAGRLRTLINEAPDQHWTAHKAGGALAMSEATLRRRLASEGVRFEDLLVDIRMQYGLMLLQTTSWSIPRIASACGYQSRARFADRFRARFGYLPSAVR